MEKLHGNSAERYNRAIEVRPRDGKAAVEFCDRAIEIWERLVHQEGRRELAGDLAWVKGLRGLALVGLGEAEKGNEELMAAVKVLREEIARTGRTDLEYALHWITNEFNKPEASVLWLGG